MAFGSLAGSARVLLGVDTRDFNRDLSTAEGKFRRSTGNMQRDVGQLSRGMAAGTGAFQGFAPRKWPFLSPDHGRVSLSLETPPTFAATRLVAVAPFVLGVVDLVGEPAK